MSYYRMTRRSPFAIAAFIAITVIATSSCDSWYYGTMKKFGMEKRDILVKRVTEARKSQEEAKDQFKTALERFKSVIEVEGGERVRGVHAVAVTPDAADPLVLIVDVNEPGDFSTYTLSRHASSTT